MIESRCNYQSKDRVWRVEVSEEGSIVASAYVIITGKQAKIGYVTSRQQGMGSEAVRQIITLAQQQHCTTVVGDFIPVPECYESAYRLYACMGFSINEKKQTMSLSLSDESSNM